jgi:hypothetical protein
MFISSLLVLLTLLLPSLALSQSGPMSVPSTMLIANDTTTGTTQYQLAKIVGGKAIRASIADATASPPLDLYVCMSGCGISGPAQLVVAGEAYLEMDTAVASGASNYFIIPSTSSNGKGHPQSAAPATGIVVGRLWQDFTSTATGARARIAAGNQPYIPGAPGPGGSGTVNNGNANAIACYSGTGTVVDDCVQPGAANIYPKWAGGVLVNASLPAAGIGVCTNQVVTGNNADTAPTCATVTSTMVNNTIALTGAGINTASQPIAAPATWAFQGRSAPTVGGPLNDYTGCTTVNCDINGGTADRDVSGFAVPPTDGAFLHVCNGGTSNNLILRNENTGSAASARLRLSNPTDIPLDDITLVPGRCTMLQYSTTLARWRAFGGELPDYAKVRPIGTIIGDPEASSSFLLVGNNTPEGYQNHNGRPVEVMSMACWADAGAPTVQVRQRGTGTSVLTADCVCGAASWGTCSVASTSAAIIQSWTETKTTRTCTTPPCGLDFVLVTVPASTTKYVVIDGTGILR